MADQNDDEKEKVKRFGILAWILTILLIASTCLNLWQKHQIMAFEKELQKCQSQPITFIPGQQRTKRSIPNSSNYFLPLYTQLTPQAVKQLCANQYETIESNNFVVEHQSNDVIIIPAASSSSSNLIPTQIEQRKNGKHSEKNRTKWKTGLSKNGKRKNYYYKVQKSQKTCPLISKLHEKKEYGARMYEIGSAIRSNDLWYITEYAMGYMLFEYNSTQNPDLNVPINIYTLPMPFSGTDNTIATHSDGTRIFYFQVSSTTTILGYNVKEDKSVQKELNFARKPLYKHSPSEIDLEFDEGNLYVIYREPNNTALTILKLHPFTLKQLEKHQIAIHFADHIVNCFIRCHVLYAVKEEKISELKIEPIFNFAKNEYFASSNGSDVQTSWKSHGIPSNVQYDSMSETLNVFDKGHIYSISIEK